MLPSAIRKYTSQNEGPLSCRWMVYFWWYVYLGIQMFVSNISSDTLWIQSLACPISISSKQVQKCLLYHKVFVKGKTSSVSSITCILIPSCSSVKKMTTTFLQSYSGVPKYCSSFRVYDHWRWMIFARNTVECWHYVWMNQCYDVSSQIKNFFSSKTAAVSWILRQRIVV